MNLWLRKINNMSGQEGASPSRAQTLPADAGKRDEHKKRSFFTLGKKK